MINSYSDDLLSTSWLGEVVDVDDPQKIGRIRVKVFGKFDDIATEDIPWAYPGNNYVGGSSSGGGFISVPKLGSVVSIKFDMGNIYHPEYFFNQKISDEVKAEIEDSYTNAHVIVYDTVTDGSIKIFFTEQKGLMIDYKQTQINIKPDKTVNIISEANISITSNADVKINCSNADITASKKATVDSPKIELGRDASESVILGDSFAKIFDNHIHPTPTGPSSKTTTPMSSSLSKITKTK